METVTPRGLRNQNVSLIDKLKAKQRQLKDSLINIRRSKSKTPEIGRKPRKSKTPKLAQGKENVHPKLRTVTVDPKRTNSSTPVTHINVQRKTPKSILKKRKIIDDNVRVTVPSARRSLRSANKNNSNANYSDNRLAVLSPDFPLTVTPIGTSSFDFADKTDLTPGLDQMDVGDLGPTPCKIRKNVSFNLDHSTAADQRLADPGNLRTSKSGGKLMKRNGLLRLGKAPRRPPLNLSRPDNDALRHDEIDQGKVRPLLGYDWIAGNLDTDPRMAGLSDQYLEDLKEFRRMNKEDCVSQLQGGPLLDISRTPSPEIRDPEHTCIHTYAINSRLFTVPLNANYQGESVCPICSATRRKPTSYSPGFVRVSIPQGVLKEKYQRKTHRRKSFDPSDSYALTEHCLAGWENARPVQMPTATVVDLRHASGRQKSKQPTTLAEAQEIAHSSKRKIQGLHQANTTRSFRQINSENLLNTSHALRYNLQQLERMGSSQRLAHSTSYPLL